MGSMQIEIVQNLSKLGACERFFNVPCEEFPEGALSCLLKAEWFKGCSLRVMRNGVEIASTTAIVTYDDPFPGACCFFLGLERNRELEFSPNVRSMMPFHFKEGDVLIFEGADLPKDLSQELRDERRLAKTS
jgi:hypothetical protein